MGLSRSFARLLLIPALVVAPAWAAEFPTRPITCIGPFEERGGADIVLRALGQLMKEYIGQPFINVNRPGGAGLVAGKALAEAKPDGYTVGALISTAAVPEIYTYFRDAPYTSKDLRPLLRITTFPFALFVKADAPWQRLEEFLETARSHPGPLRYAHPGKGHIYHLLMEAVERQAAVNLQGFPTKGGAPSLAAVLNGHVPAGLAATAGGKRYVEGGRLRMLAVQHTGRLKWAPEVPTFTELGHSFGLAPWYLSLFVPARTPDAIATRLHDAIKAAMDDSRFRTALAEAGLEVDYADPDGVRRDLETDRRVIGGLLQMLGMNP